MRLEVQQVADGVHQARTRYVAWALVLDGDEVTLVDSGWPRDHDRLAASLERVGRRLGDVTALVLTHGHRDHEGNAVRLQREHRVPVLVHEAEVANARGRQVEEVPIPTLLSMAWRPEVLRCGIGMIRLGALGIAYPQELSTFGEGPLDVPGRPWSVFTPGHTSGHAALHLPERGVLLAGDALMTYHPMASRRDGVRLLPDYFNHDTVQAAASLERLRPLAASVVVPGHGPPFLGTPGQAVQQALDHRTLTAGPGRSRS